jgi:hypothetical protein
MPINISWITLIRRRRKDTHTRARGNEVKEDRSKKS